MACIRETWAMALRNAKFPPFPAYELRHTFASCLAAAGDSRITVAQVQGHSLTSIVMKYGKTIDECRRSAIAKLEEFRWAQRSTADVPATGQSVRFG